MNDGLYQGIIAVLSSYSAITALIGAGADARIYRQAAPAQTAYPFCYLAIAHPGDEVRYYGLGGRDRNVYIAIGFVGRNDTATADRDVVLLDQYADTALTNLVTATGLTTFMRYSDVPDGPNEFVSTGTVDEVTAGGIYHAYFQL